MTEMADEEQLYDVLIPPGVPRSIIFEVVEKFPDVKVIDRKEKLTFANMEGDERELLAFRAKMDVARQVEKFVLQRVNDFINEK
jgi:hypothetical protein